ncbi:Putative elongator complex protein 1 [Rhodotorula toruloides]
MRSISVLEASFHPLSSSSSTSPSPRAQDLVATTTDAGTDTTYAVTLSSEEGHEEVVVHVWRMPQVAEEPATLLTSFLPPPPPPTLPSSQPFIVSLKYLPEDDALALVLANGDVEQVFLEGGVREAKRENVGTFDYGIKAASWSPDEELLAIVTGNDQLLVLAKTFDPLSEQPLHTSSFGADAPVSVGWGHKSTQFHGSLGKSAAAAAAKQNPLDADWLESARDDGLTRIAWRGDSAWFAVNSLERAPPRSDLADGEERRVRRIRIYSRLGEHSSTSEPVPGLEGSLAWIPSGEIIASTQRKVVVSPEGESRDELQVMFFERNGLRRYEFGLRERRAEAISVRELGWNAASDLLAVWIERDAEEAGATPSHAVQLWHRSNYYWYLKAELAPRLSLSRRLQTVVWHPEKAQEIELIAADGLERYSLCWETFSSQRPVPLDDGTVAVVDGVDIKLTPFRLQNVPPPMSSLVLRSSRPQTPLPPAHISFSASPSPSSPLRFAVLYPDSFLEFYSWTLPLTGNAQRNAHAGLSDPVLECSLQLDPNATRQRCVARQCAVYGDKVAVLRSLQGEHAQDEVVIVDGRQGETRVIKVLEGARKIAATQEREKQDGGEGNGEEDVDGFVLVTQSGEVLEIPAAGSDDFASPSSSLSPFPEFCQTIQHVRIPPSSPSSTFCLPTLIGLAASGRLYSSSRLLASDATSFTLTSDFLIYTTFSHEASFIPLSTLSTVPTADFTESFARRAAGSAASGPSETIKRAVERGSRIVTVVPSSTTLILQMPRGNLETICPRPLVLRVVRSLLDSRRYRAAFLLCRRHRIDLNILHDHDPEAFVANLHDFVSQVKDIDYLNLFLSGLKDEDVTKTMYKPLVAGGVESFDPSTKVNTICRLVRDDLEQRDVFHFANTILTSYVRQRPPAYEDALNLLVQLKAKDAERAEDAVKYIIFLSDSNKLFDLALGMYDFPLVLMIAQQSQKDPREYLPFLRALRSLPPFLQCYKIDDHLGRYASALRNLSKAGDEHFDEALEYTKKHGLFEVALRAYEDDKEKYEMVLSANAEHLFDRSNYFEAALLFTLAAQPEKAMLAYQRARAWQELFTLALTSGTVDEEGIKELAADVADDLSGKRRYGDAAKVLLDYGKDVDAAVAVLCEGSLHAEAMRVTALHGRRDLVNSRIKTSTLELQERLCEDCSDLTEQVQKQLDRLAELRTKRDQNPYFYYCVDDPTAAFENVEIAPDGMSDAGTAFTRYTVNPTTLASTSRRTSKTSGSRRRAALKKAAGKKGTVYEEMYLLNSLKKTAESRLAELQRETAALLPVLLILSSAEHRTAAIDLQSNVTSFETFLSTAIDSIWSPLEQSWRAESIEEQRIKDTGDPMLLAEWEQRPKPVEGEEETRRVERPVLAREKWRIGLLDAQAK